MLSPSKRIIFVFLSCLILSDGAASLSLRRAGDPSDNSKQGHVIDIEVGAENSAKDENNNGETQEDDGRVSVAKKDATVERSKLRRVTTTTAHKLRSAGDKLRRIWRLLPKLTLFLIVLMTSFHYSLLSTVPGDNFAGEIGHVNSDRFKNVILDDEPTFFVNTSKIIKIVGQHDIKSHEIQTFGLDEYCSKFPGFCDDYTGLTSFYRIITSQFTHASFKHLFGNMFNFLLVGTMVEKTQSPSVFLAIMLSATIASESFQVLFDSGFQTYAAKLKQIMINAPNSDLRSLVKNGENHFGKSVANDAGSYTFAAGMTANVGFSSIVCGFYGAMIVAGLMNIRESYLLQFLKKVSTKSKVSKATESITISGNEAVDEKKEKANEENEEIEKGSFFKDPLFEFTYWMLILPFLPIYLSDGYLFEERQTYSDALKAVAETVPSWGHFSGLIGGAFATLAVGRNTELERHDSDLTSKKSFTEKAIKIFSLLAPLASVIAHGCVSGMLIFKKQQVALFTYSVAATVFVLWHFCASMERTYFGPVSDGSNNSDSKQVVEKKGRESAAEAGEMVVPADLAGVTIEI